MKKKNRNIHIISLGTSLLLSDHLKNFIQSANHLFASKKQIQAIKQHILKHTQIHLYPKDFKQLPDLLPESGHIVCLASGDSLFFGVGSFITQAMPKEKINIHPNISSLQSACAHLNWAYKDVKTVSLHGRPLNTLKASLHSNGRFFILTDALNTPKKITQLLKEVGLNQSKIWVFECLDQANESKHYFSNLEHLNHQEFKNPNVMLIQTEGSSFLPIFPGIDDQHWSLYKQKKCFSKKTIRLHILSSFQTQPHSICWDIGAGYGAMSIEWSRWNPSSTIYAIEQSKDICEIFKENQEKFGDHQNIKLYQNNALKIIEHLPKPHCIMIGGNNHADELDQLLKICIEKLHNHGKIAISAVTENTKHALWKNQEKLPKHWHIKTTLFQTHEEITLGEKKAMKPNMQIQLNIWQKKYPATSSD